MRHVIESSVNLYAGAERTERQDLLIYDESIDGAAGITVAQFEVNQRWQTKRGGPGRWRSVDVFTLNAQANFFINQPPDRELDPVDFRGLFFDSMPEASLARDSVNVDAEWQISDFVIWKGSVVYNMPEAQWATAATSLQVKHSPRLRYSVGWRHIGLDFSEIVRRHPWIPASEDSDPGNTFIFERQDLLQFGAEDEVSEK